MHEEVVGDVEGVEFLQNMFESLGKRGDFLLVEFGDVVYKASGKQPRLVVVGGGVGTKGGDIVVAEYEALALAFFGNNILISVALVFGIVVRGGSYLVLHIGGDDVGGKDL